MDDYKGFQAPRWHEISVFGGELTVGEVLLLAAAAAAVAEAVVQFM